MHIDVFASLHVSKVFLISEYVCLVVKVTYMKLMQPYFQMPLFVTYRFLLLSISLRTFLSLSWKINME